MSVFVTGDKHGNYYYFKESGLLDNITKDDTLIICGDFGFDWNIRHTNEWQEFKHDYTICFVRGNHDNTDILKSLPIIDKFNDQVGDFGNNTYWLLDGHMYNIEGMKFFCFGGASSIDREWRIIKEMKNKAPRTLWWEDENASEDAYNLAKQTLIDNNYTFDYFITHTCNPNLKEPILKTYKLDFYDPTENMIQGLEYFIRENNGSYKGHYFGHFHSNIDYENEHCLYEQVVKIN